MAKIGFLRDADDGGKKKEDEKKKEPTLFQQLIEQRFSPTGERSQAILLTSDDISWYYRHTVRVSSIEVSKTLKALGYRVVSSSGAPCWLLYEKPENKI